MKKLLLFLTIILYSSFSFGNPIVLPYININELYFEDGEWFLELVYCEANEQEYPIVSIVLTTSAGEAHLLDFTIQGETGFIVVQNNELLSAPLAINPEGDFIHVTWGIDFYGYIEYQENEMYFGDYPNSKVTKPRLGQSIAFIRYDYSKDNSPTIGIMNDTIGAMGTLSGTVYDINLDPVQTEVFLVDYSWLDFTTSETGEYAYRTYSNTYNSNGIYHKIPPFEWIDTEIHYIMEPDSVVNYDIYLLEEITVGISEPSGFNAGCFRFFPNPVSKELSLNFEINYSENGQNLLIEIKSIASEQIFKYPVATGEGIITLPGEISPGVYFVNLRMGENLLSSGKLVINR